MLCARNGDDSEIGSLWFGKQRSEKNAELICEQASLLTPKFWKYQQIATYPGKAGLLDKGRKPN